MKTLNLLLVASAALLSVGAQAATGEEIMTKSGCMACHKVDAKLVGPALKDIAKKYKGQDVLAKMLPKVRAGGPGVWGPIPMSPNPIEKISDADLKTAVQWILSL
ncbi:MAG: cytochrome C [Comamonadaceae bacterium]|jgi:cytochrome c|nr:c-type cytochrome [Rhodoferax sp.]TSA12757.1 MAG: cytochrome C [Comamonadaceae bacterium]